MVVETRARTLFKTISWRLSGSVATGVLVYIFTGRLDAAFAVGGAEIVAKMAIYYVHERAWASVKIGKKELSPSVIWITGLPSSGKKLLSEKIYQALKKKGFKADILDGRTVRELIPQIGFDEEERVQHIQRVGLLVSQLERNGIFVVANFVSPDRKAREFVRGLCKNFVEVHVATPLEECEKADDVGLYKKARQGEVAHMVGVHFPYQESDRCEFRIDLSKTPVEQAEKELLKIIEKNL